MEIFFNSLIVIEKRNMNTYLLEQLPPSIQESDELSVTDKVVLGGIIHSWQIAEGAQEDSVVVPTERLRKTCGIRKEDLLKSQTNLTHFSFFNVERGKPRANGVRVATKYTLDFESLFSGSWRKLSAKEWYLRELSKKAGNADGNCKYKNKSKSESKYKIEDKNKNENKNENKTKSPSELNVSIVRRDNKEKTNITDTTVTLEDSREEVVIPLEEKLFQQIDPKIEEKEKQFQTDTLYLLEDFDDNSWLSLSQRV